MNPYFVWSLVMSGRVFTFVAENASLTLVYWKQTVLAEVASWNRDGRSHVERTDLKVIDGNLNAARYRDEIIAPIVLPFLRRHSFSHVFQHDNARPHVARVSMDFLNDNNSRTLPWPALSPDLKLIKHLWDELGRRVRNGLNPPETLDDLRWALIQEWNNIPQTFIRKLIGSMRRRCQAVIHARGGHTHY